MNRIRIISRSSGEISTNRSSYMITGCYGGLMKVLMGPQKTLLYAGTPNQILWSTPVGDGLGKIQSYGQSAGNFEEETQEEVQEGSSETIRKEYNKEFIDWLVGLVEGDGSFIISERNLEFKITQSSTDAAVLFYIKKELGFGSVVKQSEESNTHQYRVRNREGIRKIIEILNGKLQLKKRKVQFEQ